MESSSGGSSSSIIVSKGIQNPFTLKVGQVFTGFGVGCGLGIGVGRPINLASKMKFGGIFKPNNDDGKTHDAASALACAIPVLNQVMVAARGASDVFSGVGRHVNHSLKMVGARNMEAGIGCGVGFGHGFGVGIAIKPGVVHQIQTSLVQTITKVMMKFGATPTLSNVAGGLFPQSSQSGNSPINPLGNMMKLATGSTAKDEDLSTSEKFPSTGSSYASRTEKIISNFLQSPLLEGEAKNQVGHLQSEKDVIELVLKQQLAVEKLKEESEKLQQILVEDLKVSPDKFKVKGYSGSGSGYYTSCNDCLECRRRQRRDRRR
ncbi:hypothetical protein SSX86_008226 [Deinandra increscens subsp. villosa]|uniref:Uncharacterized protein n=1 Tax=Deinandra increscens subsp. villosa TaxID=3103831 RepID=A0AAP0DFH7_9ASTR